jgi:hypothetical protein
VQSNGAGVLLEQVALQSTSSSSSSSSGRLHAFVLHAMHCIAVRRTALDPHLVGTIDQCDFVVKQGVTFVTHQSQLPV